ncbi:MAG: hypothetical protein ACYC99_17825 [Candidatus Geothermincolia bacterium]
MARTYSSGQTMFAASGDRARRGRSRRVQTLGRAPSRLRGPAPIVLIAALIALVVVCWVFGRGCGTNQQARENDKLKVYTTDANKLMEHSASTAQAFSNLANGVGSMPKADADKQLSDMKTDCKSVETEAAQVKVPSKATNLQPLARLGFKLRTQGVTEYQTGIMALLNGTDRNAAVQSIQAGLGDLVVSDAVLANYRGMLETKLKSAKAPAAVADPGKFVATFDSASTAAINSYVTSIAQNVPASAGAATAAANPSQAMAAYFKAKGIDSSSMSYEVVSTSASDPNWKIDIASDPQGAKTYFLLHNVNGSWTVVDAGTSITADKLKSAGAPSDLKAVP